MAKHDCQRTKKKLMELVFGELAAERQPQVLAAINDCRVCSQEHQALLATLRAFDQTADAVLPDESYWVGYEAHLRTKLAESVASPRQQRWAALFAWLLAKPALPLAITAGLLLITAISIVWFSRRSDRPAPALVVQITPTPQPIATEPPTQRAHTPPTEVQRQRRVLVAGNSSQARPRRQPRPTAKREMPAPDVTIAQEIARPSAPAALPVMEPTSHFEKAQLLLRSFRNTRSRGQNATIDVAYEKRAASKLIYDNILLRRAAEAKGQRPVEDALNSLEPLLLDIANLPDQAARAEVQIIRDRMQRQELVATLQVIASGTERFNAPALLKQ
jgi:hypothetical protein